MLECQYLVHNYIMKARLVITLIDSKFSGESIFFFFFVVSCVWAEESNWTSESYVSVLTWFWCLLVTCIKTFICNKMTREEKTETNHRRDVSRKQCQFYHYIYAMELFAAAWKSIVNTCAYCILGFMFCLASLDSRKVFHAVLTNSEAGVVTVFNIGQLASELLYNLVIAIWI